MNIAFRTTHNVWFNHHVHAIDRKTNIEFYKPKEAKCSEPEEVCCKRTEKIDTVENPGATKCSEWGDGYECTTLEHCEADTFAIKDKEVAESTLDNTISFLFGAGEYLFAKSPVFENAVNPNLVRFRLHYFEINVYHRCP